MALNPASPTPTPHTASDGPAPGRTRFLDRLLNRLFLLITILGAVPFVISCQYAAATEEWFRIWVYTGFYIWAAGVAFGKFLAYPVRAWAGIFWFFCLGGFSLAVSGFMGSTRIYLICFTAFGALFMGVRGCILTQLLSILALAAAGWVQFFLVPGAIPGMGEPVQYLVLSGTFLFLSCAVSFSFAGLIHTLELSGSRLQQDLDVNLESLRAETLEKDRLQQELARSEKMKNLGDLAGTVAHDLNNILAGMATYPEVLLMNREKLPGNVVQGLEIIRESGRKASSVVGDLLTISKGGSAEHRLLNLNTVVAQYLEAREFRQVRQDYPGVTLDTSLEPELFNTKGSYLHIEKAVINLLRNGFEESAAVRKGRVVLSTSNICVEEQTAGFEGLGPGEYVMLKVADNGAGIQEAYLEKIFDPFFTRKEMGKGGTGLGLAMVWNAVQDHKGHIRVDSTEAGTCFTLLFPAVRARLPVRNLPGSIKEIQGRGQSILVVDDLPDQRKIAGIILKKLGYKVFSAANGMDAVAFIRETPVDLLILDMVMEPHISGLETFRRIREIRPAQKAIIASGHSVSEEVREAQELGAGSFVKKPYTILDMGIAVKEELEKPLPNDSSD